MLEQASYCYLLSKPPMLHKYGFHLVLSGDRYKKCDQVPSQFSQNIFFKFLDASFKTFLQCPLRLIMQFVHIEVPFQFIKELHGATSKIMFISILDSKLSIQ